MITKPDRKLTRVKRHMRIRRRLAGNTERPRLCIYRSNKHIYAQIVDDSTAKTLVSASTLDPELREKLAKTWDRESAASVGSLVAKRAKEKGISKVVFDRGGYIYHGRIAAVAEAARESGLDF
ncbi:MAG TPA: 50S ribosomal protein L18 [Chroococcales cyanobacterium]